MRKTLDFPEQRLELNSGITIPYVEHGEADGRTPLVLLNGISMPPGKWGELPEALDRHSFAIGLPGPEDTSYFPTLDEYARTTVSAMRNLVGERAHVLGLSWGGILAQQVAADYPQDVDKMVLAATMPATPASALSVPNPSAVLGVISPIRSTNKAAKIYGGDFLEDPSLIEKLGVTRKINPLHHMRQQQALMMSSWQLIIRRTFSNTETLVMAGDDDPLMSFRAARLGSMMLGAEFACMKKGGHGFLFTRPEKSAEIINEFLDRND